MKVTYVDDDAAVTVSDQGSTILEVSLANRIPHIRECGGRGKCTTCRVQVLDGLRNLSSISEAEQRIAEQRGWDPYTRLACQARVHGDVCIRRMVRSPADISLLQVEAMKNNEGSDMNLAVLVCDIRQFTPFVDSHLAYDVYHILNRFFGELGEPILLNNGLIYQYVGDQIVGLFGLNGGSPGDACEAAVRAGLGMIRALEALNDRIEVEFGVRLGIRVGAHFGPLLVGYLGHPAQREFSIVGDAINVASRIEGVNKVLGTTFLVSRELSDRVDVPIRHGFKGPVVLRGKEERFEVVEVVDFAHPDADLLVQETARMLLDDKDKFADTFYGRLFAAAPDTRRMFTGDMSAQGRMLTQVLQLAVYGLSRFQDICPGLATVGRSHDHYGVSGGHYTVFRQIFLDTVRELLGEKCQAEVEEAWATAIDRILVAVQKGSRSQAQQWGPVPPGGPAAAGDVEPAAAFSDANHVCLRPTTHGHL